MCVNVHSNLYKNNDRIYNLFCLKKIKARKKRQLLQNEDFTYERNRDVFDELI